MSGHLDGPPPGPPDPPYIPGDLGAPSAEEFARRRASPTPEERNPYAPSADWKPGQDTFTSQAAGIWAEGFAAGRAAATPEACARCVGDGMLPGPDGNVRCEACQGTGRAGAYTCSGCDTIHRAAASPDPPDEEATDG